MQEKRLTRRMKQLLRQRGLNPENWRYIRHTPDELVIVHKHSSKQRVINFFERSAGA